jgi:hypothetical protein
MRQKRAARLVSNQRESKAVAGQGENPSRRLEGCLGLQQGKESVLQGKPSMRLV